MIPSLCKIVVRNRFNDVLTTALREFYDIYYMQGYNYILCYNGEWDRITKIQKKRRVKIKKLYTTNLKTIYISNDAELLSSNNIILNTKDLNIYIVREDSKYAKGYSIITENNKSVQVDDYFVRFNEVKRA